MVYPCIGSLPMAVLAFCFQSIRVHALRRSTEGSCVRLKNMESYSTVEVSVGTPPQKFDLIADTGSDNLIVTSCSCVENGHCAKDDKCFRGSGASSTFAVEENPPMVTINFGSGPVQSVLTTDNVRMGGVTAKMEDSLLLMVDKDLEDDMEIEGILGLGLPKRVSESAARDAAGAQAAIISGFLENAQVKRFSLCFNAGEDGVLRLGGRSGSSVKFGNVGSIHWSVGLEGVSVGRGSEAKKLSLCDRNGMKAGQVTPCAAIVDSGTTMITAPAAQLAVFYEDLCDGWARCRENPSRQQNVTEALFAEVATCNTEDMPVLQFHISGSEGTQENLELGAQEYTIKEDNNGEKSCILAFDEMDLETDDNGPTWIFGTPFYYKYHVGYDMSADPPAMSFTQAECIQCGMPRNAQSFVERPAGTIRSFSGQRRTLNVDRSLPL